eukprot:scaffold267360_cov43-Tisochrysis_lutea.AAC.3
MLCGKRLAQAFLLPSALVPLGGGYLITMCSSAAMQVNACALASIAQYFAYRPMLWSHPES